ncbi:ATPase [Actinophytocola xinjiangensis]|uniref:ATPase n=1 Tax=Actinophytocola xinjiangensis TaxID=485602 RepID=A0A7Z1AUM6_9PSEU|nr:AAA family ATPase [Actinophytocola xinjiangensis]OLF04350.1 ATPase [Actinophytocola xinjiangensis]
MPVAELIGRDHPSALLRAEIARAAESHGGLVLVTGEAGIGKTTLVTAAVDDARRAGALVLSGTCWDSAAAPGYWPWTQAVRALRRQAGEAEWAAAEAAAQDSAGASLDLLLGGTGPAEPVTGFQLYDAVTSALVALAQSRPVVVVLDDLHWADPESVRLLEFVAQHTWFERLLLIGTYRDVEVEAPDHPLAPLLAPVQAKATTVTLTGLDEAEVGALIARTAGSQAPADLVAEVHQRTGGNPFFVEQTVRLWHGGNAPTVLPTVVAPGVRDAVRRRLSLLAPVVSALLTGAAVLGREFDRRVLAATVAAPVPQVARLLDEAVAARLVLPQGEGRFTFAHDLVREALYESLDDDQRRRRHAEVVRALDNTALAERIFPADLARHAHLAGDELDPPRVIDLMVAAAKEARRRASFVESLGHYRRALDLLGPDDPLRVRINLDLGTVCHSIDQFEGIGSAFQEAAEVALRLDDPEILARAALTIYGADAAVADADLQARLLRTAHARVVGGDGDGDRSLDVLVQELLRQSIANARDENDHEQLGFGLWAMHDRLWGPGHAEQRRALTDELRAIARRSGDVEMEKYANSLGWVAALELGSVAYLDLFNAFIRLSEQHPDPSLATGADIDQTVIGGMRGRFDEAFAALARVTPLVEHTDHALYRFLAHHLEWALAALRGDQPRLAVAEREAERTRLPHAELTAGIAAAQRGDAATATHCLAVADARAEPAGPTYLPLLLRLRAQTAALTGDPRLCERSREELTPLASTWLVAMFGCDVSGPVALWLAGLDAAQRRWPAAVEGYTEALRSAELLGARPWVVEAKVGLAAALRGRGSPPDGERARALAGEAAREAAELGLRHRAPAGPPPPAPAPTPNEFRRAGSVWTLSMAGRTVSVPDAKGLRDLHVLLASPGTEIPAVRLLDPAGGEEVVAASRLGGDDLLDDTARAAYQQRLATLDDLIDEATLAGDDQRAARFDEERAALLTELRAAVGLGGRARRLGDETERARKTVTARIRDTLRKLADAHPELAGHLREAVSTGTTCGYHPPRPTDWRL